MQQEEPGQAVALDPQKGTQTATINLGAPALIPPVAMNGSLYVVTDKADLIAIR